MSPQLPQHLCWGELCCVSGRWQESSLTNKVCKAGFHILAISVCLGHHPVSVVVGAEQGEMGIAALPGMRHCWEQRAADSEQAIKQLREHTEKVLGAAHLLFS